MKRQRGSTNGLLMFLIYGMFALFSLLLVVIGARIYRNIVATGEENTAIRSSFSYISNKIRMSSGTSDTIRLEQRDGIPVLVLTQSYEETDYETLIYYYDGALLEYYGTSGQPFAPESGEKISDIQEFLMEEPSPGQLLFSTVDADGNPLRMHLNYLVLDER